MEESLPDYDDVGHGVVRWDVVGVSRERWADVILWVLSLALQDGHECSLSVALYTDIYIGMYVRIQSTDNVTPNLEPHSSSHSDNTPNDAAIANSKCHAASLESAPKETRPPSLGRLDAGGGVGQIGK